MKAGMVDKTNGFFNIPIFHHSYFAVFSSVSSVLSVANRLLSF